MKERKKRSLFGDIFHFLTSNGFAALIGIASSIILARTLGPHNKGIYTVAMVIPRIIIGFSFLGIRQSTVVNIGGKKYNDNEILSSLFYLFLFTSIIGVIICSAYFFTGTQYTKDLSIYAIIAVLCMIPVRVGNNYLNSFYLGKSHFRIINRTKWLNAMLFLLFVFILVYVLRLSVLGAFLSMTLTAVVTFIILISLLFYFQYYKLSGGGLIFDKTIIYRLVSLGIVYAIAYVIIQLNLKADVLILRYFKGNESVGFYSIAVALAQSVWLFPTAVGTVMVSRTANTDDINETIKDTNIIVRITTIIAIVSGIFIFFVAPILLPLVYGHRFLPSIPMVQTIIPGIIFIAVMRILTSFISGTGKPWVIIIISFPALLINILLNIFIIPLWGGIGAAIATDVSYFIGLVFTIIYYTRKYNVAIFDLIFIKKDDVILLLNFIKSKFRK